MYEGINKYFNTLINIRQYTEKLSLIVIMKFSNDAFYNTVSMFLFLILYCNINKRIIYVKFTNKEKIIEHPLILNKLN